jgi:hypothetical protein
MGKKKAGLVEAITDASDILVEDKTRCGPFQNLMWINIITVLFCFAFFCFVFPYATYEKPGHHCGWTEYNGNHYTKLRKHFYFSHKEKEVETCYHPRNDDGVCMPVVCTTSNEAGELSFQWLILMFSTLSAFPYFITFMFYPGWAYKLHFRGGGAMCCGRIPLTCGKVASANDEQSHQADQMSRLLGCFIGLTFGIINYMTRMGTTRQGDGLICHSAVWFLTSIFHISSLWNKGSPRCYALYQLIFSAALGGLMYMTTGALDDFLDFSLNEEMKDTF